MLGLQCEKVSAVHCVAFMYILIHAQLCIRSKREQLCVPHPHNVIGSVTCDERLSLHYRIYDTGNEFVTLSTKLEINTNVST